MGRRWRCACMIVMIPFFIAGCEFSEYIEFSPHVTTVPNEYRNLNDRSLSRIAEADDSEVRIAVISDTHSYYSDLKYLVSLINGMADIDFVVVAGDITEKGLLKEFEYSVDVLSGLAVPYFVNIGNHECLGNGRAVYKNMFGSENFSFVFGNVRMVFLNLCLWECNIGDISFIENYMKGDETAKIVIVHTPPDCGIFSDEQRALYGDILQRNNVSLSVHGHAHTYDFIGDFDGKGFDYLRVAEAKKRAMAIIDVEEDGTVEVNHAYY